MVAPDGKWIIFDDLAHQLCPGDIRRGRAQIREALAGCERWIDRWTKRLDLIRRCSIAIFTTSLVALVASAYGLWPSGPWDWPIAGSVLVWGLCEAAPVLLQKSFLHWSKRFPLNDELLASLKAYLAAAAKSPDPLHDHDGNAVAPEFLLNPWAVLLFSERDEIRQLPTTGSKGLRRVRYAQWLNADRPTVMALPQTTDSAAHPVTILVDQSVTNIDQRTQHLTLEQRNTNIQTSNHFEFITRISAQADATVRRSPEVSLDESDTAPFEARWPCSFEEADFHIRLKIFEAKALCLTKPSVKPLQIKKYVIAVLAARRIWTAEPGKDIAEAAKDIGKLIKSNTDGWTGLQQSDSTDWIKSVIGGTGNYAFAKEAFIGISYDPAEHDDAQYRLLLQ